MNSEEINNQYQKLKEEYEQEQATLLSLPQGLIQREYLFEEVSSLHGRLLLLEKLYKIEKMKECEHIFIKPIITGDKRKDCYLACIKCGLNTKYHTWSSQYLNRVEREMFSIYCTTYQNGLTTNIYGDLDELTTLYFDMKNNYPDLDDKTIIAHIKRTIYGVQMVHSK